MRRREGEVLLVRARRAVFCYRYPMSNEPTLLGIASNRWSTCGRPAPRCLRPPQVLRRDPSHHRTAPPRRGVLEPNKGAVLDVTAALDSIGVVDQTATLGRASGDAFYTSEHNPADLRAKATRRRRRADCERLLNGCSPRVQDILRNFGLHYQFPRPPKTDALGSLIEKLTSPGVNPSPEPVTDSDGRVILPGLGLSRPPTVQGIGTWRTRRDPDAWLE